jgi:hypothetical protein
MDRTLASSFSVLIAVLGFSSGPGRTCAADLEKEVVPGLVAARCTIARDDDHHLGWPTVCMAADGSLVCSYSVADVHGGGAVPQA